jgi:tripartite-type tricarboxylate transporter receptor subunit TctC
VVDRLNKEVNAALRSPAVLQKFAELDVEAHPGTVQQSQDWVKSEVKYWGDMITHAGIEKR